jgi:hypothetical protein
MPQYERWKAYQHRECVEAMRRWPSETGLKPLETLLQVSTELSSELRHAMHHMVNWAGSLLRELELPVG